jgi:hypothetical protein
MPLITQGFRTKHIYNSTDPTIKQIVAAISTCKTRHEGQNVTANTVMLMNEIAIATFESSVPQAYLGRTNVYLSPVIPHVVNMSQMGILTMTTNTQFTYRLDSSGEVSNSDPNPGLVGGVSTQLHIIPAINLAEIRIYRRSIFPGTRGFTAQGASAVRTGMSVTHEGAVYIELRVIYYETHPGHVTRRFYAKRTALERAESEQWIQWGTQLQQI